MNPLIKEISTQGLINILSGHDHVVMSSMEDREELEGCLQCNLDSGRIDEIELFLELGAE
jgi:hypothetical protein